jgi:tRNA pseudouridine32 synthase/23S rRNA pseudouridine746 synthase
MEPLAKRQRTAKQPLGGGTYFCPVCKIQINANLASVAIHKEGRKHQRREQLQREQEEAAAAPAADHGDGAAAAASTPAEATASRPMPKSIIADGSINILFRDEHVVCLDKPANLLSVPGRVSTDSLKSRVRAHPGLGSAEPVHRLDQETSGVLLMGLSPGSCALLGEQFASRTASKRYVAVVDGVLQGDSGTVTLALCPDLENRPRQLAVTESQEAEAAAVVVAPTAGQEAKGRQRKVPKAKAAHTDWRVLDRLPDRTLVELTPRTGRTHQLRVHMAAIGHPILGDTLYAPTAALEKSGERLLLHSRDLSIAHPSSGTTVTFHAPCPFSFGGGDLVSLANPAAQTPLNSADGDGDADAADADDAGAERRQAQKTVHVCVATEAVGGEGAVVSRVTPT